jgi:hypothetical protein
MSQKKVKEIKRIMKYNPEDAVHHRLFRRLHGEYKKLPAHKKRPFIDQLRSAFEGREMG